MGNPARLLEAPPLAKPALCPEITSSVIPQKQR
jgi:hypothetical protein